MNIFPKLVAWYQATDSGSSENTKQDKFQKEKKERKNYT
jgi:hypothetical protein